MLLINAVKGGRIAQVKMFIKVGINVDEVDENGQTALIHCCFLQDSRMRIKILKALIVADVDLNKKDSFGRTVLAWACFKGRTEVVRFLLNDPRCIDLQIDVTDKEGNSTLLLSVMSGNFLIVKMMVGVLKGTARAIELNKSNNAGMRPLIAAFLRGDKLCAQLLIKQVGSSVSSVLKYLKSLQNGSNEFRASSSSLPLFDPSRGKKQTRESFVQFVELTEDDIFEFLFAKDKGRSDAQKCESQELKYEKNGPEERRILLSRRSKSKKQDSFLLQRPYSSETMNDTSEIDGFSCARKCTPRPVSTAQEEKIRDNETSKCTASSRTSVQQLMTLYAEQNSPSFRHGLAVCKYTPPQPQVSNTDFGSEFDSRRSSLHPSETDPIAGLSPRLLGESLMDQQLRLKYARNSRATSMQVPRLPSLSGMGRGRIKRTRSSTIVAMKL